METCACCGFNTIKEKGYYEVCSICYWEDDDVQEADPWFEGGANTPSLYQAQMNFKRYGAMEKRFVSSTRKPNSTDIKNPKWRPLKKEDKSFISTPDQIEAAWGTSNEIFYNY